MSREPKSRSAKLARAALDGARAGLAFPLDDPAAVALVVRFGAEARRQWLGSGADPQHAVVLFGDLSGGLEYTEDAPRVMVIHAAQVQITLEMTAGFKRGRELGKALDTPPAGYFPVVGLGKRPFVTFLPIDEARSPDGGD